MVHLCSCGSADNPEPSELKKENNRMTTSFCWQPGIRLTITDHLRRDTSEGQGEKRWAERRREGERDMKMEAKGIMVGLFLLLVFVDYGFAWTGEINGRVMCDVCSDSSVGPEDHALDGAEVAVLCITKSGEVLNYQAFTDARGIFRVAETMSETNRWESCLARTISSFHEHCNRVGIPKPGRRFKYNLPSGYSHTVKSFMYQPAIAPLYCS